MSFIFLLPPAGMLISRDMSLLLSCNFSVTKCVGSQPIKFDSIQFNIAISIKLLVHVTIQRHSPRQVNSKVGLRKIVASSGIMMLFISSSFCFFFYLVFSLLYSEISI